MTLWENVLAHYGWQGAALAAVLVVLLCVQLWYYLFAYGRIPVSYTHLTLPTKLEV